MAIGTVGGGQLVNPGKETILFTYPDSTTATNSATLTAAQVMSQLIVGTPTAAATYTLPTVALLEASLVNARTGQGFELTIINVATTDAYDITVAAGTGFTLVGDPQVSAKSAADLNSSGTFILRKTGDSAWSCYRKS